LLKDKTMDEIQNIDKNTKGERPEGAQSTITVVDINDAKQALDNCKNAVKALLQNIDLDKNDKKWETLLPEVYIKFTERLDREDYANEDILFPLYGVIEDFQDADIREWKWYSSKLQDKGFEIIVEGWFNPRFIWIVHYLNIPYSKIWIETDRNKRKYRIKVYKDITTYKTFD
jgi:hypothetical protein